MKRKDRWDDRAHLKLASNRYGNLDAQHPTVRRQLDSLEDQESDQVRAHDALPTISGDNQSTDATPSEAKDE